MSEVLLVRKDNSKVICWRTMDESDSETTNYFIKNFFRKNEPYRRILKCTEEDMIPVVDFAMNLLKKQQAVCAYDQESKRVLGMIFFKGPIMVRDAKPYSFGPNQNLRLKQQVHIMNEIYKGLPKDAGSELCMIGELYMTDPEYMGLGIGTGLVEKAMQLAKERECEFFFSDCTSFFSARIHEKLGAVCLKQIDYADYVDPYTGERIWAGIPPPHVSHKLLCHNL